MISGVVAPGFERVRELFADVVAAQPGTGCAAAMWHAGRWVFDLWGGWADAARTRRWQRDSLVMAYSVGKPFAALGVLRQVEAGAIALDAPARRYWPALVADPTVRQLLAHSAGLVALDEPAPASAWFDWDAMCDRLARQPALWTAGQGLGESALFYGHLLGELVRRTDGRMPREQWAAEVCAPLALDFQVGLDAAQQARTVELTGLTDAYRDAQYAARPPLYARALSNPPGAQDPAVVNGAAWRAAQIPAINGHGTARAIAGLYAALLEGRLLDRGLLAELVAPQATGHDRVLGTPQRWGLGVAIDEEGWGMGGLGGNVGWACVAGGYAYAFVTGSIGGFERADAIEQAARAVIGLAAPGQPS